MILRLRSDSTEVDWAEVDSVDPTDAAKVDVTDTRCGYEQPKPRGLRTLHNISTRPEWVGYQRGSLPGSVE